MRRLVLLLLLPACTLVHRAITYPAKEITDVRWYRPVEAISGVPEPAPFDLAPAFRSTVAMDALERARLYARDHSTQSFVVLYDGRLVDDEHFGHATDATTTNSMSMAKTLTALLTGIAIADGKLGGVDDPVARYVPEWANDDRAKITLGHVLTMTTGLRDDDRLSMSSDLAQLYAGTHIEQSLLKIPAVKPPGQVFEYNNADAQLMGLVLERATGRRYADYLSEKLWRPIGAGDASVWDDTAGGTAHAFCCVFATALDWARVGQMLLDGGRVGDRQVVPADWLAAMTRPSPKNPDYGYFVWRAYDGPDSAEKSSRGEPFLAPDLYMLQGKDHQRVYVVPSRRLVIVRVGEDSDWDDSFVTNLLVRAVDAEGR